jgi:AMMECR1 domain-containing protein
MDTIDPGTAPERELVDLVGRVVKVGLRALLTSDPGPPRVGQAPRVEELVESVPPFERVNVTLRCDGRIRGSMSAAGQSLNAQIMSAIAKAALDRRFSGPVTRKELLRATVEVWIQTSSTELGSDERSQPGCISLGSDGAEVRRGSRSAYYKPSVAITSGFRTAQRFLAALCRKAGLPRDSWRDPGTSVRRTRWVCIFVGHDDVPQALTYLRKPMSEEVSRQTMSQWVAESCRYFGNQQSWTGAISYIFDPVRDELLPEPLSILRAAGCLYSLSQALDTPGLRLGDDVHGTATRLAQYLVQHSRTWRTGCLVMEDGESERYPKVGTTALMLLALSFPTLQREFGTFEAQFRESIHHCQKGDGRFLTHFGRLEEGHKQIEFYPGQVLLALALEAAAGSSLAAGMSATAFEPYRKHFSAAPTTAFAGWQIDAWSRLAVASGRDDYASFAFQQADWLLQRQITNEAVPENRGGFAKDDRYPAFSSIVFVEALIRALELAAVRNDAQRCHRYSAAVRLGLQFCRRLQLTSIPPAFFANADKCVGGIAMRHDNLNVRCDVVQHFLTMSLAAHANYHLIYT